MNNQLSKEEKSAKITGEYTVKAAFIGGLVTLIGIILTWWLTNKKEVPQQSQKQDTTQIHIGNNKIQQTKSKDANIQIGNNNVSK
jgi:predicted histidine transporter YuiF (NhaC family)